MACNDEFAVIESHEAIGSNGLGSDFGILEAIQMLSRLACEIGKFAVSAKSGLLRTVLSDSN